MGGATKPSRAEVFKEFLAAGHRNPLVDTRSDLLAAGVPLVGQKQIGTPRTHFAKVNEAMAEWRSRNPYASKAEQAIARDHLWLPHVLGGAAPRRVERPDQEPLPPMPAPVGVQDKNFFKLHDGASAIAFGVSEPLVCHLIEIRTCPALAQSPGRKRGVFLEADSSRFRQVDWAGGPWDMLGWRLGVFRFVRLVRGFFAPHALAISRSLACGSTFSGGSR